MDVLKHVEGEMEANSMIKDDFALKGSHEFGVGGFNEVLPLVCWLGVEFILLILFSVFVLISYFSTVCFINLFWRLL